MTPAAYITAGAALVAAAVALTAIAVAHWLDRRDAHSRARVFTGAAMSDAELFARDRHPTALDIHDAATAGIAEIETWLENRT